MKKRFIGFTTVSGMLIACWLSPQPINAQAIAFAQNTIRTEKTTTSVKTVQLKEAILSLKAQYNVDILFEEKNIKNLSVPTNSLNNTKNIEDALETLLKPNGLKFKKMNKNTYLVLGKKQSLGLQENSKNTEGTTIPSNTSQDIAIKEVSVSSPSITKVADRTVSGKVVDENNNPLPGTSVTIKGSNRGTSTNAAGEYSLSIPEEGNAILVASFIGYKSQEIMVGKRTSINISMSPNDGSLDEVVVIGYGTQKKKDLTGS
ncbi:MAG: carboxypeptidase-like regulatory domain-containing protein, partial [Pseudarcicella sp.]|nr:carboxypeptidase-like regulatory domain-containing protein [Pseudarcicella sp.]MBP6411469.1 carboxypeptidase-like regulatory domain-containing protein [Pseudarcicella sp.]